MFFISRSSVKTIALLALIISTLAQAKTPTTGPVIKTWQQVARVVPASALPPTDETWGEAERAEATRAIEKATVGKLVHMSIIVDYLQWVDDEHIFFFDTKPTLINGLGYMLVVKIPEEQGKGLK